jgi:hypothetical protein
VVPDQLSANFRFNGVAIFSKGMKDLALALALKVGADGNPLVPQIEIHIESDPGGDPTASQIVIGLGLLNEQGTAYRPQVRSKARPVPDTQVESRRARPRLLDDPANRFCGPRPDLCRDLGHRLTASTDLIFAPYLKVGELACQ